MNCSSRLRIPLLLALVLGACSPHPGEDAGPVEDGGPGTRLASDAGASSDSGPLTEDTAEACQDGVDNDLDGLADCDDPGCGATVACRPQRENDDASCSDGVDNDQDGYPDCRDHDCNDNAAVTICGNELTEAFCTDGFDNDGNGYADCADFTCQTLAVCAGEGTETTCADGVDNDEDGAIDCDDDGCAGVRVCAPGTRVRIVAGNLSSGPVQAWDLGHGRRILEGIAGDVLLLQELNLGDEEPATLRAFVDAICGPECEVHRESGASIPNAVVSRWPIVASGVWEDPLTPTRAFPWAQIRLPGGADLWAVSVHLLTSRGSDRAAEAAALVDAIEATVPSDAYLVIGGDFNANGGVAFDTLGRVVRTDARPVDEEGNSATSADRTRRLDGVLASPSLRAHATPLWLGRLYPYGAVVDTRVLTPLSAIAPARLEDSGAEQMQHMAVVRQFTVPE